MQRRFGRDDLTLVQQSDKRSRSPASSASGRQMYGSGKIDLIQEESIDNEESCSKIAPKQNLPPQA